MYSPHDIIATIILNDQSKMLQPVLSKATIYILHTEHHKHANKTGEGIEKLNSNPSPNDPNDTSSLKWTITLCIKNLPKRTTNP